MGRGCPNSPLWVRSGGGGTAPPQKIFEFYFKMACFQAFWGTTFKFHIYPVLGIDLLLNNVDPHIFS